MHMWSPLDDLKQSLHTTFSLERNGGVIIVRDDSTLMLVDCCSVHMHAIELIRTQYPNVEIYVESYTNSSSGYIVFFVLGPRGSVLTSSAFFQFVFIFLVATFAYSLIYPHVLFNAT